jgi:hypothetical protein
MARQTIQRVVTPLYDQTGTHVLDRTDEWVVDTRDGVRHLIQDPRPTPPPVRPGGPLPPAPPPLPEAARRQVLETYPTPRTLELVVAHQQARQAGQVPETPPPPRPSVNAPVCRHCLAPGCQCGITSLVTLAQQLDAALKLKQKG